MAVSSPKEFTLKECYPDDGQRILFRYKGCRIYSVGFWRRGMVDAICEESGIVPRQAFDGMTARLAEANIEITQLKLQNAMYFKRLQDALELLLPLTHSVNPSLLHLRKATSILQGRA